MKRFTGFTLVELMIVVTIIAILAVVIKGAVTGTQTADLTWGINGVTESRCIDGYRFIVGQDGGARQIMDEMGRGVRCQ